RCCRRRDQVRQRGDEACAGTGTSNAARGSAKKIGFRHGQERLSPRRTPASNCRGIGAGFDQDSRIVLKFAHRWRPFGGSALITSAQPISHAAFWPNSIKGITMNKFVFV